MKCFCNKLLQTWMFISSIIPSWYQTFICFYQYYSLSPRFIRCLYAVFGYKHFLTTINCYWELYTTFGSHILLSTAIYYFRGLYTTFNGYILLSTAIYCFSFTLLWLCKNPSLSWSFFPLWIKYLAWIQ